MTLNQTYSNLAGNDRNKFLDVVCQPGSGRDTVATTIAAWKIHQMTKTLDGHPDASGKIRTEASGHSGEELLEANVNERVSSVGSTSPPTESQFPAVTRDDEVRELPGAHHCISRRNSLECDVNGLMFLMLSRKTKVPL